MRYPIEPQDKCCYNCQHSIKKHGTSAQDFRLKCSRSGADVTNRGTNCSKWHKQKWSLSKKSRVKNDNASVFSTSAIAKAFRQ